MNISSRMLQPPRRNVLRFTDRQFTGLLLFLLAALLFARPATAGTVWLQGVEGISNVPISSIQERRFERVVRQQFDFSCGSAALATLLTFHYDQDTGEQEPFRWMYERGDQEKISRVGFSLLDMKKFLESVGYEADGYRATLDTLGAASVPAIALISIRSYRHFVVVKGVRGNEVLLGDPALGLRKMTRQEFEGVWENGILFIIRNKAEVGGRNFNTMAEWSRIPRAPLGLALAEESLASVTISLPGFGEF
jgi:predicted double-glycine peptidase